MKFCKPVVGTARGVDEEMLEQNPERVMSYFQEHHVRYGA